MLRFKSLFVSFAAMLPLCVSAGSIGDIASRLMAVEAYSDSCTYEVLLPSFSEPVNYRIGLESLRNVSAQDTLAPCSYIIRWSLATPSGGTSEGFSAYFDGDLYRFRDKRLQEYHASWDVTPFSPLGRTEKGVQNTTQFVDLLPQFLGRQFELMERDSSFVYEIQSDVLLNGVKTLRIEGERRVGGYVVVEYTYYLDSSSLLPVRMEFENNPGQISEQSVTVSFDKPSDKAGPIDLQRVTAMAPEAFEKYRESSFALENLPGRPLPRISAKRISGERYIHNHGEAFPRPTVFAILDSHVATTPDVIRDVTSAIAGLPLAVDVVWVFVDKRADDITPFFDEGAPLDNVLVNGSGFAGETGAADNLPVLIFCAENGNVTEVVNGFNNDLVTIVIQKAMLTASAR